MPVETVQRNETPARAPLRTPEHNGVTLTRAGIEDFMDECKSAGCSPATLERYRTCMERIFEFLPGNKAVRPGSLDKVRDDMLKKGYSPYTVNLMISVSNVWLDLIGHRELQVTERVEVKATPRELTRREYVRLLQTAKEQGDERRYLLIKLFALTDVTAGTLKKVTVEAVEAGQISMPEFLTDEILDYAGRKGIAGGQIFLTRAGEPLARKRVPKLIQRGSDEAMVEREKVTPKCLSRLKIVARADVENNMRLLAEQYMDSVIADEEAIYGWDC